jgi:DNA-binding MarR family transcriptional regulator
VRSNEQNTIKEATTMPEKNIEMKEVDEIGEQMIKVKNFFIEFFNKVVRDNGQVLGFDFGISQLKALAAFHEDQEYTMGALSKNASVTMPSMTEMIDGLERDGIVERWRDSEDRRVVKVHLTEKGKEMRRKFMMRRRNEFKNIFGKLSKEERDDLVNALEKVSTILHKVNIGNGKD